jgi:cytoskeletal protein CcmA (bactofilin family)
MKRNILLTLAFFIVCYVSFGTTYTSIADGDWDDDAFWDANGAPPNTLPAGDIVIVDHVIDIDADIEIAGTMTVNGTLTTSNAKKIGEMTGTFTNNGTITIKQIEKVDGNFTNNGTITLTNEFKFDGNASWTFTNSGSITATKFKDDGGGYPDGSGTGGLMTTLLNTSTGTMNLSNEFKFDGAFTNEGDIQTAKLHVDGDLCNKGTITTTGEVQIHGGTVSCTGTMTVDCSAVFKFKSGDQGDPSFSGQNLCCSNSNEPTITFDGSLDGNVIDSSSVSICSVVLPVKWADVKVIVEQSDVKLEWSTYEEINNAYFEIEKSVDGSHFISVGEVQGSGNTNQVTQYEYYDYDIFNDVYYRLKQVDVDGKSSYSKVIHVVSSYSNHHITVYPNPTQDYLNIIGELDIHTMKIVDSNGKEYYSKHDFNLYEGIHIELKELNMPKGVYFIYLQHEGQNIIEKVVIE